MKMTKLFLTFTCLFGLAVLCNAKSIDPLIRLLKSIKNVEAIGNVANVQGITNDGCLQLHNRYRAKHGADPLEYDAQVEKYAILRANHLAEVDAVVPDDGNPFGENLYQFSTTENEADMDICRRSIDYWYEGVKNYSYDKPGYAKNTGDFTQIVWKSSAKLGCAKSKSKSSGNYHVVCNYYEHGNEDGAFEDNVSSQ